jgi:ATP-binding cassette subfamily B protein
MPLIESLPERLAKADGVSQARVAVATDLTPDGAFGSEWLVVTSDALRVYPHEHDVPRVDLKLGELRSPDAEGLVGGGALTATIKGERIELLRYSNAQGRKFSRVAGWLKDLRKHLDERAKGKESKEPELHPDDEAPKRCPRCKLLLPEGTSACPACVQKGKVILRLMRYLRPHRAQTALVLTFVMLGMLVSLVTPYLTRPLMDHALAPVQPMPVAHRMHNLGWIVLLTLFAGLANLMIGVLRGRAVVRLGGVLTHDLRTQLYSHLQLMSLRFFDRRQTGQVISRVTQDTQALESVLIDGVQYFVVNILLLIGIGGVLAWMNWRLTLLVLLPVPAILLASRLFWPRLIALWHRFHHIRGRMVASVNDALSGMRVVKAFAKEKEEIARFDRSSRDTMLSDRDVELMSATFWPVLGYITSTGAMLVTYFGGRQVIHEELTVGTLFAFQAYLGMFYGPLQYLSRIADYLARSLAAGARVFEVLDSVPEVREATEAVAIERLSGAIRFEKVTFGYDRHKPALKEISFEVRPGEMIGLVGQSGAGKSTLINLICRFYEVDDGRVEIDGVDIRKVRQRDLRSQIGVVLQDTFLFNGTIAENIAYARPGASAEDVLAAAKAANAHDFIIGKPDGYDSLLGERGLSLSGGERQRIAIARAILHDPRILILDEATASVDTDTEKQIQEAISRLVKGRTTIAIAHRLSTLRNADRLLVLKNGGIAETGTHEQLLANENGEFARLVKMQQELQKIVEIA